ncbi:MAG: hypothetical protein WBP45_06500 [Daejeonella sp.]
MEGIITFLSKWFFWEDIACLIILLPALFILFSYLYKEIPTVDYGGGAVSGLAYHLTLAVLGLLCSGALGVLSFYLLSDPLGFGVNGKFAFIHCWVAGIASGSIALFIGVFPIILFVQSFNYIKGKIMK